MKLLAAALLMRPALAIGAASILPVLGWQASTPVSIDHPANLDTLAPAETAISTETVISKTGSAVAWSKAHRSPVRQRIQAAVEVVTIEVPAETDPDLQPDADLRAELREPFADWLQAGPAEGSLKIIEFKTRKLDLSRAECGARHHKIAVAFGLPAGSHKIMADKAVLFQSSLCAENGEIVVTCFGGSATISPRRARPGSRCARRG